MIFAKSDPPESLKEHTKFVIERFSCLKATYKNDIDEIIPTENKSLFWDMLYYACLYHDSGKAYTPFQNEIRSRLKKEKIETKFKNNIPHGYLSPAFMDLKNLKNHFGDYYKLLVVAIASHHERDVMVTKEEIHKAIVEDLEKIKGEVEKELEIEIKSLNKKYINLIPINNNISFATDKEYMLFVLLKGLLKRLDHSASAHLAVEDNNLDNISKITLNFITARYRNLREVQKYCFENNEKNMIIVASTGIGKTEAALLWAGNKKCFYTLPLRVALNSMYERIRGMGVTSLGLLHSSSLDYLENQGFDDAYEVYESSRMLSYRLNLSTIDQIFGFPFRYKGHEKVLATLAYSKIVMDEIQAYSPKITAVLLKGIEILHKFGTKFLIITATLPQIYKDYLEERNINFESSKFLIDIPRHMIKLIDCQIEDDLDAIIEKGKNSKVLLIVNTIKKAIDIYNLISKAKEGNVNLLHSQFISKHRMIKEKLIKRFDMRGKPGIWITTQVVEASIDIDFDFLFTELSSLDSLFQRMGRCYRKRNYSSSIPNVYIYVGSPSGIGSVYDKDIYNLSKDALKDYNQKIISEKTKFRLIEEIYSKNALLGTDYYKEFVSAIKVLDNFNGDNLDRKDVQRILRTINNIKVIPKIYYDKNIELFNRYLEVKDFEQKTKLLRKINSYCVDIPFYQVKNNISEIKGLKGIYVLELEYNSQIGVIHNKEISGIIG